MRSGQHPHSQSKSSRNQKRVRCENTRSRKQDSGSVLQQGTMNSEPRYNSRRPTPAASPPNETKRNQTKLPGNPRTVEKDCVRPIRFRTDAVTSSNTGVRACFRMTETRKLPGAPKAAERLRQKVQPVHDVCVDSIRFFHDGAN